MLVKLGQYANAPSLILLILFGISTFVNSGHHENTHPPILVTLFGITMLIRLEEFSNAAPPILVTLSGISKFISLFPVAYYINFLPSIEYEFPSIDLKFLLFGDTFILFKFAQ